MKGKKKYYTQLKTWENKTRGGKGSRVLADTQLSSAVFLASTFIYVMSPELGRKGGEGKTQRKKATVL